jgi:hypothetical protein
MEHAVHKQHRPPFNHFKIYVRQTHLCWLALLLLEWYGVSSSSI